MSTSAATDVRWSAVYATYDAVHEDMASLAELANGIPNRVILSDGAHIDRDLSSAEIASMAGPDGRLDVFGVFRHEPTEKTYMGLSFGVYDAAVRRFVIRLLVLDSRLSVIADFMLLMRAKNEWPDGSAVMRAPSMPISFSSESDWRTDPSDAANWVSVLALVDW